MSLLKLLRDARTGPSSFLHQYLLNAGKSKLAIHAFVEGQDDRSFYLPFLRSAFRGSAQLYLYVCRGKRNVYKAFDQVQPRLLAEDHAVYFVDKDLDDLIPEAFPDAEQIYVTETYSIENYLVSERSVEEVWSDSFGQAPGGDAFELVLDSFNQARAAFYELSSYIAAWTIHHRRLGTRPQIANLRMDQIASLSEDLKWHQKVENGELVAVLDECCHVETTDTWYSEANQLVELTRSQDSGAITKGKHDLWFLVKFLARLRSNVEKAAAEEGRKLRVSFQITETNAVELLTPRIDTPPRLEAFLTRIRIRLGLE